MKDPVNLMIILADGSGSITSMPGGARMIASVVKGAVAGMLETDMIAYITFDHTVQVRIPPTVVVDLSADFDFDPSIGLGGGTNLEHAMEVANRIADDFLQNGGRFAVTMTISDN